MHAGATDLQFLVALVILLFSIRADHAGGMRTIPTFSARSRFLHHTTGTTAVEFAMLAPLFMLLLLGMVAYGIYFGASHSVQQIAADAARTALSGLNATERKALVTNFINNDVNGYPFVDVTKLTVDAKDSVA